jgi:hypothetical protein
MDPKLKAALHALLEARNNAREVGEQISPADQDAFIKRETGGKFGFKDLKPLLDASPSNLVRSVMNGATMNLADNVIGMFSPEQADESRLRSDFYKQAHPHRDLLGGLLGGLVTGKAAAELLPAAGEARTIGQTVKAGAKSGAGYGAASRYGAADDQDFAGKLDEAGAGAVTGGIAGGVLSGALGAGAALFNPARHSAGRIAHAMEKDGGLPALQAKLQEFVAAGRGDQVTVADLGPHLRQALDFAANASDDVLVPVAELLETRQADRASRLLADARAGFKASGMGEPNAALRAGQLQQNTRDVGNKVYGDLAAKSPEFDVSSLPLDKPKISRLWEQARAAGNLSTEGPLDALIKKLVAANPGADRGALTAAAKQIAGASAKDAGGAAPAMERPVTMDDMMTLRQGLQGQADQAFGKNNYAMGSALKDIKTHVDDVLEQGAPGMRAANVAYKGAKDLERSLASGEDWWMKADKRELARAVDAVKSQPGALDEFRHGIASGLVKRLQSVGANRDAARELLQASDDLEAKLRVIFGDKQTFDTFMSRVKAERELGRLTSTVGNSATARRLTAQGHDPENLGLDLVAHGPGMIKGALLQLAKLAMTKRVAEGMGPKLLTQGAGNIEKLLPTLGQQGMLAGPGTTMMSPMGLMSLFNH